MIHNGLFMHFIVFLVHFVGFLGVFKGLLWYFKAFVSAFYGLFGASLVYFGLIKAFTLRTLIVCWVAQILLTYALSFILHVDIPAYLDASLKIIDAYQDAMAAMLLSTKELLSLLVQFVKRDERSVMLVTELFRLLN